METGTQLSVSSLKKETALVFSIQLGAVVAMVQWARTFGFEGELAALIGALFIFLPVIVLDRRGKPYKRYGLVFANPLRDLPAVLLFIAVSWPPIVAAIFLMPRLWGLFDTTWQFTIPSDYFSKVVAHFLVIALPEEFFFRGYLLGRLDDIWKSRFSLFGVQVGHGLWISSALFALGHFMVDFHVTRFLVFFPALAFGYLRLKRNSIAAPIIFHGCCNVFMDIFRAGFGL